MVTLAEQVALARLSWQSNYTRGDEGWRCKQLHNLHRLLLDHSEEIASCFPRSTSPLCCQRELALLVGDINQHISHLTKDSTKDGNKRNHLGRLDLTYQAVGVSLIISGLANTIRNMVAPLAASIAAGNITVLATATGPEDPLVSLLVKLWARYLDPDCLFFAPRFNYTDMDIGDVDVITIYDNSPVPYNSVLASPKARFYDTSIATNLGIVTEGKKSWPRLVEEIGQMSSEAVLPSDRLHAVFVNKEDANYLEQALSNGLGSESKNVRPHSVILDTALEDYPSTDLELHIQSAKESACLLLISVETLERVIDAMISLQTPIQQLAILGPQADKTASFVPNWVSVRTLSAGFVYPVALPISTANMDPRYPQSTLFPSSAFSKPLIHARQQPIISSCHSVEEVRAMYKYLAVQLKPEPRGERIGFFKQVEYLVKGVGATFGMVAVAGLIYGIRQYQSRLN